MGPLGSFRHTSHLLVKTAPDFQCIVCVKYHKKCGNCETGTVFLMHMGNLPEIAILLPIKNGENYVLSKIKSLQRQKYQNFKVLISVNISTDRTLGILSELTRNDKRFIIYEQQIELSIAENIAFLISKAQTDLVLLTAVDDLVCENFLIEAIGLWTSFPNTQAVIALAKYEPPMHGDLPICLELSCEKNQRLRNLFNNIRVSHAMFYCLTTKDHLRKFSKKYPSEFVGRDWVFGIFTCLSGPVLTTMYSEITFSVNGASRQPFYLFESAKSLTEKILPYGKMVREIIKMAQREGPRIRFLLYVFSAKLILGNIRRFTRSLIDLILVEGRNS